MSPPEIDNLASELLSAYRAGERVATLPSLQPGFDLDAAYAVEAELRRAREAGGTKSVGRKVGYANKVLWRIFKLRTLVWAHMYDDTVHYADNNLATLALPHARSLKVEPEIVFGLKQLLTSEARDPADALAATDWLAIGFEVIDCPYPDWKLQPSDFLASLGLHAALVVGERVPVQPDSIPALLDALPNFGVRVAKNGEIIEEGLGKNVLGSPALCLAELGAAIAQRFPSEPLSAGEIVSSGTLTSGHPAGSGETWTVVVSGLSLPQLTLHLA